MFGWWQRLRNPAAPGAPAHLVKGERGERVAARHLQQRGYKILTRRFHGKHGEIDLVARDREVLEKHFVMDAVKKRRAKYIRIDAYWCPKELDCSWAYKSSVPASTFDIMEDGELYCRGIVIDLME